MDSFCVTTSWWGLPIHMVWLDFCCLCFPHCFHLISIGFVLFRLASPDDIDLIWFRLISLRLTWFHLVSLGLTRFRVISIGVAWLHFTSRHWFHLVSIGFTWFRLASLRFTWFHLASLGFTWFHLASLDFTWFHLVSLGFTGFRLVSLDSTWFNLTSTCFRLVSLGFPWCRLVFTWPRLISLLHLLCVSLDFMWLHMISHGFTWFHFFAFGSTWLHLDSFGFTWFHLDSTCFTRFHAVSHGFTSSHLFYMVAIVCCWSHLTQLELHKENKLTQGKREIPQWLKGKGKAATSRFSFCIHLTSTPRARTHERTKRNETISRLDSPPNLRTCIVYVLSTLLSPHDWSLTRLVSNQVRLQWSKFLQWSASWNSNISDPWE